MTDPATLFPVASKKKLAVVITDETVEFKTLQIESTLYQVATSERNEADIVNAVTGGSRVNVPKIDLTRTEETTPRAANYTTPPRAYSYYNGLFARSTYTVSSEDLRWIEHFNSTRQYSFLTIKQFEEIYTVIEEFVLDQINPDVIPTLEIILARMGNGAPPVTFVSAVYERWKTANKLANSVLNMEKFPPDHCSMRTDHIKANYNKSRKTMQTTDYIKRLQKELATVRNEKNNLIALVETQKKRRMEDILFARSIMRKAERTDDPTVSELLSLQQFEQSEPEIEQEPPNSTIPQPPPVPHLLAWCLDQSD